MKNENSYGSYKTNNCNITYCGSVLDKKIHKSFSKNEKQAQKLIKQSKSKKFRLGN